MKRVRQRRLLNVSIYDRGTHKKVRRGSFSYLGIFNTYFMGEISNDLLLRYRLDKEIYQVDIEVVDRVS